MKLENEVCSKELALELKELGVKQESVFYYGKDSWRGFQQADGILFYKNLNVDEHSYEIHCSAFTFAELGAILPNAIVLKNEEPFDNFKLSINKFISVENNAQVDNWMINYECDSTDATGENAWLRRRLTTNIYDPNAANGMAKMLIYLIENKLIELP